MKPLNNVLCLLTLCACVVLVGCPDDSEDNNATADGIEIAGDYVTNFESQESVSTVSWGPATVIDYNNADNWAITQQPADDEFNPNKFNRLVWTEPAMGEFYYCMIAFGLESEQEARDSTKTADASNPEVDGCGGFSWTKMTPQ